MNKQELENLPDEEIETLVKRLMCDVKQKRCEVDSINKELEEIQNSIHRQQAARQKVTEKMFRAEEAAPLIEEGRKLQRELKEKQNHLSKLSKGEAKEQSEVKEFESKLNELISRRELQSLEEKYTEKAQAVQSLQASYKEKQAACQRAKDDLPKLQKEVDMLNGLRPTAQSGVSHKTKRDELLTLTKKLDDLVLKRSREAGLKI